MRQSGWLAAAVVLGLGAAVLAVEMVEVPGSSARFAGEVDAAIGGKAVKLGLTGVALRTKLLVNVYAIASYVEKGAPVSSPEALAQADCPKRLHLAMERSVDGKDMAEAFRAALRLNHPEPAFAEEMNQLLQFMRSCAMRKGEHAFLTHVPGIGLQINVAGKADFLIKNVAFSQAVWEMYLGKKNVGEAIKRGLTSRL
jgi:hypothetical protein